MLNGSCYNISVPSVITITNPYPSNTSTNAPLQPTIYITVNHSNGTSMNISWYYGLSQGNENNLLGTDTNQNNGTVTELFYSATNRTTTYYWRVQVDDGTTYVNDSFYFKTEGTPTGIVPPNRSLAIIAMMFGVFGIISMLMFNKKRKKRKKYKEGDKRWNYR